MLAIPLECINDEKIQPFGKYRLIVENIDTEITYLYKIAPGNGMKNIFLEPGKYKVNELRFIYNNQDSKGKPRDLDIFFNIERGKYEVFSKKLYVKLYSKETTYYMRNRLWPVNQNDVDKVHDLIAQKENSNLWSF